MIFRFFFILGVASSAFAAPNLVNGIAFFVNNQPITLVELYKTMQVQKVDKNRAMQLLIQRALEKDEIAREGIEASGNEVDKAISKIAKSNGSTTAGIREFIESQGASWSEYYEEQKEQILRDKLYGKIVANNIKMVDERELLSYYEANEKKFLLPSRVETIKYSAKNHESLRRVLQNPLSLPRGIVTEPETIFTQKLNPQLAALFYQTKTGEFTQIFTVGEEYLMFLIKSKEEQVLMPFENAKEMVFNYLMKEREERIIKEYFEKLQANAKIRILRLQ